MHVKSLAFCVWKWRRYTIQYNAVGRLQLSFAPLAQSSNYATGKDPCWSPTRSFYFSASGDSNPSRLYQVRLPIISNESCHKAYNGTYRIIDEIICAGDVESGGIGTCYVRSIKSCLASMSQSPFIFVLWFLENRQPKFFSSLYQSCMNKTSTPLKFQSVQQMSTLFRKHLL